MRLISLVLSLLAATALHAAPVVRCHSILVNPSTGPVAEFDISSDTAWSGTLTLTPPDGWTLAPASHEIALQAGESKRIPYHIVKARETPENAYPFTVALSGLPPQTQILRAASAPYYKPKIDGRLDEWKDAIPIRFGDPGEQTTLRTYWNQTALCFAIEVEEKALVPSDKKTADGRFDAVQLYIAPKGATAKRHEFLIEPVSKSKAVCKRLASPDGADHKDGTLEKGAAVAIRNSGGVTTYEIAIPLALLQGLRVDTGSEYRLGLLVHDPDGSGLRDLGTAMNLPRAARASLVTPPSCWTLWKGGCWDNTFFDGGTEFGFCTSIH